MTNRILFLSGILFFLIGQTLLAKGQAYVNGQEPIDFAHWFLLVGAVLLIPQVITHPKKNFGYIGVPLTIIGIVGIIGMCVLDFIFWSYPDQEGRNAFYEHISKVPSVWDAFMVYGSSSKIFNVGLLLIALDYIKTRKVGIAVLVFASLILWNLIPVPNRLVSGYGLTLVAFALIYFGKGRLSGASD